MTTRETFLPSEMGVVIGEEAVPEEILRASRKARRKVAQEARQGTSMIYARPEAADDAVQRYKFEREHKDALEEEAVRRGITVPELAYIALSGSEEGARVPLDGYRAYYACGVSLIVVRAVAGEEPPEDLAELAAFGVVMAYRYAQWENAGRDTLLRRGKLWSYEKAEDVELYARTMVYTHRPW
jgi:hypothetical protein